MSSPVYVYALLAYMLKNYGNQKKQRNLTDSLKQVAQGVVSTCTDKKGENKSLRGPPSHGIGSSNVAPTVPRVDRRSPGALRVPTLTNRNCYYADGSPREPVVRFRDPQRIYSFGNVSDGVVGAEPEQPSGGVWGCSGNPRWGPNMAPWRAQNPPS